MSTPDITFRVLGGAEAGEHADELQALHADVYGGPPQRRDEDAALFAGRFRVQRRQPGFVLAEARHGGYLVGYAAGFPLRPSTSWWRHLTTALPEDVTAEHPGRTFAVADVLVRPPWRRQGIGAALHDLVLRDRPEERATLTVPPAAAPAQAAFRNWGGARSRGHATPLPAQPSATCSSSRCRRFGDAPALDTAGSRKHHRPAGDGGSVPAGLSAPGRYWVTVSARRGSFQPGRTKWQV